MRLVVFILSMLLAFTLAQSGGGISSAITDAITESSTGLLPAMVGFLGILASVALGWAVVKVIRG